MLDVLKCFRCSGSVVLDHGAVVCDACSTSFGRSGGVLDFAPDISLPMGLKDKLLKQSGLGRLYKDRVRPSLAPMWGTDMVQEETWLVQWFRPANGPLLEHACGGGDHALVLAKKFGFEGLFALDLSTDALAETRSRLGKPIAGLIRGDASNLPFRDRSLGGVNCFGGMQLFDDPRAAVFEVARVLMPGGVFTGLTAAHQGKRSALKRAAGLATEHHFIDEDQLQEWCRQAGLDVLSTHTARWMTLFAAVKPT